MLLPNFLTRLSLSAPISTDDEDSITPNGSSSISFAQLSPMPLTSLQTSTSHVSQLTSSPVVTGTYSPKSALDDLPGASYALQLFLESHMIEAEEYCHKNDSTKCFDGCHAHTTLLTVVSQRTALLCKRFWVDTMCQGSDVFWR